MTGFVLRAISNLITLLIYLALTKQLIGHTDMKNKAHKSVTTGLVSLKALNKQLNVKK